MVGLLFAEASSQLAREEIIPRLHYFHHRSGNHIDFFCSGYGAYWQPGSVPDQEVIVKITDSQWGTVEWLYSTRLFSNFLDEIEPQTPQWKYSGEVDLLLLNAYPNFETGARLDFSSIMIFRLRRAKSDKLINSAAEFFECIFRYAKDQHGEDPLGRFSDLMGLHQGKAALFDGLLSLVPSSKEWKKEYHYAVLKSRQADSKIEENFKGLGEIPQAMP